MYRRKNKAGRRTDGVKAFVPPVKVEVPQVDTWVPKPSKRSKKSKKEETEVDEQ